MALLNDKMLVVLDQLPLGLLKELVDTVTLLNNELLVV
jgi:hypothetical protein